jgi:hypothetical protein
MTGIIYTGTVIGRQFENIGEIPEKSCLILLEFVL